MVAFAPDTAPTITTTHATSRTAIIFTDSFMTTQIQPETILKSSRSTFSLLTAMTSTPLQFPGAKPSQLTKDFRAVDGFFNRHEAHLAQPGRGCRIE